MYPKWKYHATLAACIVGDEAAEAALGPGWADTPAAFTCTCGPNEGCPNCCPIQAETAQPEAELEAETAQPAPYRAQQQKKKKG